jgi:hypothetical protein
MFIEGDVMLVRCYISKQGLGDEIEGYTIKT